LQDKLYAQSKYAVLFIFQGMDASGKDSIIKHVMGGINPQGCRVVSFKQPAQEELNRDYLWRIHNKIPERGMIGIFNRSHYEEVLTVRVNNLLKYQNIPEEFIDEQIWKRRFRQIVDFEKYLYENGIIIKKFFLHISSEEQKKRFLKRIEEKSKNWKFSKTDVDDRKKMERFSAMLRRRYKTYVFRMGALAYYTS
jgi:PPK2 family polyphosphate:nucleotide phosphotransferase